jgi:Flp pilus assembly protein TadD
VPRACFARTTSLGLRPICAALAEQGLLKDAVAPDLENRIRAVLAAILREEGKKDEAKTIVKPACETEKTGPLADYLKKFSLCL